MGVVQVTESKRCEHCEKMLAQIVVVGMSAFCLSASAAVSSDLISTETTVVMLRPDAMAGLAANAEPNVDGNDFAVITRPIQLGNSGSLTVAKQSVSDFGISELSLERLSIINAEEVLRAPRLLPSGSEIVAAVPKRRTESLFILDNAAPRSSTIANHETPADVPRMTRDTLLADALEAFAEGDYSGDFDLEFAFDNLSEFPEGVEALVAKHDASFEAAPILPILRPQYFGELHCLAEAIYFEARGEKALGQQAVAEVIINRVKSDKFPDKICEVVTQGGSYKNKCQFSFNCDGLSEAISEKDAYAEVRMLAFRAMQGEIKPVAGGATYFHATWANPRWAGVFEKTAEIGSHVFYQERIN